VSEREVPSIRQGDQPSRLPQLSPSNRSLHLPPVADNPP